MKDWQNNTLTIKTLLFIFSIICNTSMNAQYIWGTSENFYRLKNSKSYNNCYKIESQYKPTKIIYEMPADNAVGKRIVIENVDYENHPVWMASIRVSFDEGDTLLLTDSSGMAYIDLSCEKKMVKLKIPSIPQGFYLPIKDGSFPQKVRIVWGSNNDNRVILTIYSKKKLNYDEILAISNELVMGKPYKTDDLYYYFSDE